MVAAAGLQTRTQRDSWGASGAGRRQAL